jgi:hypothetical protein
MRNILLLVGGAAALFFLSRYRFGKKAVFTLRGLLTRPVGSTSVSFTGTANVDGLVVPVSESKMI